MVTNLSNLNMQSIPMLGLNQANSAGRCASYPEAPVLPPPPLYPPSASSADGTQANLMQLVGKMLELVMMMTQKTSANVTPALVVCDNTTAGYLPPDIDAYGYGLSYAVPEAAAAPVSSSILPVPSSVITTPSPTASATSETQSLSELAQVLGR